MTATTPDITPATLTDFVYAEARMLDALHFNDWLDLFTEDGHYWMPLTHDQTDPRLHTSLMYEDKLLLRIRIERLVGQRTFSQQPKSRCHHLLQAPVVESAGGADDRQTLFAGWATHRLVVDGGALKIRQKRVDLVNCDAPFANIQLFM